MQLVKGLPWLLLLLLMPAAALLAQTDTAIVKFRSPAGLAPAKGYSHAAIVDLGNCKMIVLSGQVPLDSTGNLVGPGDVGLQTDQVFRNISRIVSELGGSMKDVIKIGIFLTDLSQIQAFRNARDKFIQTQTPPVSTLVQVTKLFRPDVLVEVEATAIIPSKRQ